MGRRVGGAGDGGNREGNDVFYGVLWVVDDDKSVLMKCWWNALRALPAASQVFYFLWFQQKPSRRLVFG